jgi:dienelactone hydrolase
MTSAAVKPSPEGLPAEHLHGLSRASGRVGCIGFRVGGRYTLLMAVSSDRLDAVPFLHRSLQEV